MYKFPFKIIYLLTIKKIKIQLIYILNIKMSERTLDYIGARNNVRGLITWPWNFVFGL